MYLKKNLLLVLIVLVMCWPLPIFAQDKSDGSMQYLIEKVSADKRHFVRDKIKLSEEESELFWPVYEEYQNELFLLRSRTLRLVKDYAEDFENMSDETAGDLLDEFMAIKALDLSLRQVYLPRFRQALPDVKVLRYYQIENKIDAALMYEIGAKIPLVKESK